MTTSARAQASPVREPIGRGSTLLSDRRMAVVAGAGGTLSVAAVVARLADKLSAAPATVIALVGATIGLLAAFHYVAKLASAPNRTGVLAMVSTVGLVISGVTILAALPHLTKAGGLGIFSEDLVAELWALTVLAVVAGSVRTLDWRTFVAAGATGFLAIPALATLVGRPIVTALGTSSVFAVSVWVPLTEELCKMIPVAFVVLVALRRAVVRPSALDLMLLGAWTGAGFAVYENATFGRGAFDLSTVPVLSLLFPYDTATQVFGSTMIHSGHLILSAVIGLSIGLALLYRNRVPRPHLVLVGVFLAAVFEHGVNNALAARAVSASAAPLFLTLTCYGYLTSLLLVAGVGYALYLELRVVGSIPSRPEGWLQLLHPSAWLHLSATEAERRSKLLARAQLAGSPLAPTASPSTPMLQVRT